jgi:hypothetical protein
MSGPCCDAAGLEAIGIGDLYPLLHRPAILTASVIAGVFPRPWLPVIQSIARSPAQEMVAQDADIIYRISWRNFGHDAVSQESRPNRKSPDLWAGSYRVVLQD